MGARTVDRDEWQPMVRCVEGHGDLKHVKRQGLRKLVVGH